LTEALTQLVDHVARSDELIRQLLVVDDVTRLNEQLLEEAAVWIATGNQLQQRAVTIAVTDTKVLRDRLSQRLAGRGPRLAIRAEIRRQRKRRRPGRNRLIEHALAIDTGTCGCPKVSSRHATC
jgi:hypothetical protein